MKICADTYYFLELTKGDKDSVKLLEKIENGEHILFVPVIALTELLTILYQKGKAQLGENIFAQVMVTRNIHIVPFTANFCIRTAKIKHSFGLSISDASIVAAYKISNSDVLIAKDSDFSTAIKQNYIKTKTPKELL
ncbi:MAG: PIN domain-containing protein [Candidatus Aenigmarchaeota archaeon]|nr:PIN domain-containing protein [Candidatus Aenigmarchaeota archaeon]